MPANRHNGYTEYGVGLGLRVPHYRHILANKPTCAWFEIISENFMVEGGRPLDYVNFIPHHRFGQMHIAGQRRWFDGTSSARAVAKLVKPSGTLKPLERVEIYNRMYWFRLLDSLAQDFPGLRALLGEEKFWPLCERYLAAYPSRSFTLRDLGSRLGRFIASEPKLVAPYGAAARDLVRFEWAQIIAFDGPSRPRLSKRQLAGVDPATLRFALQPYLTLLTCRHPVDEYILATKSDGALRMGASNAVVARAGNAAKATGLKRGCVLHLVVHRVDNQLYYKRLEPEAARLLRALKAGQPLAEACALAFARSSLDAGVQAETIRAWFTLWMRLGWLCKAQGTSGQK